jgi:hypothetical protein
MWTIWLLHCGLPRQNAAEVVSVSLTAAQRYVDAYRFQQFEDDSPISA